MTNGRTTPGELVSFYPRGQKKLYSVFAQFGPADMISWLHRRGIKCHTEADLRVFPSTNASDTIVQCFVQEARRLNVHLALQTSLTGLQPHESGWKLETTAGEKLADRVIVCAGSSPAMWEVLAALGLEIVPPVPSLFTFNISDARIQDLAGLTFENAHVRITGTKLAESGPLLVTHWGLSGPAVLKLSAWGARILAAQEYQFEILVNFANGTTPDSLRQWFDTQKKDHPKRLVINYPPEGVPRRFWERLLHIAETGDQQTFGDLPKKLTNKLVEESTQGRYRVTGKSTFKDEFVTAGGVALHEINLDTFESRRFPGLFLAGEVLDIDALTGGFNFQACWSAGWIIAHMSN